MDQLRIPAVVVLTFDFEDGDEAPFGMVLDCVREATRDKTDVSIHAAIGGTAQDVIDLTRHW